MPALSKHQSVSKAVAVIAIVASVSKLVEEKSKKRKRRWWTRQWILSRQTKGVLPLICHELQYEDADSFQNYLRMDSESFHLLLSMVKSRIAKKDTHLRQSIPAKQRLAVTLRFLATGESFKSLMFSTRIPHNTISKFVPEVCGAIYSALQGQYLKVPSTTEEWLQIAKDFYEMWNFPHCLGALDGKHISFRASREHGSFFYNYKHTHSIVLLALVNAKYQFTYVNVGVNGRINDAGVFRESDLNVALTNNTLNVPTESHLPNQANNVPYVIITDDAFPLQRNILKPFPERGLNLSKRIFNYRLSRARRVVENAFGILANRFRIFLSPINLSPEKVEVITLASCALHNYLGDRKDRHYAPPSMVDTEQEDGTVIPGEWRTESHFQQQIARQGSNRSSNSSAFVRHEFMEFFVGAGRVPWQDRVCI